MDEEKYRQEQEFFYEEFDKIWPKGGPERTPIDLNQQLYEIEKEHIKEVLDASEGNRTKAAKLLNIGRTCLIAKMRKFELV